MLSSLLRTTVSTARVASFAANPCLHPIRHVTERAYATASPNLVNIVEVGPRDGLQNEKGVITPDVKIELINRLGRAGMKFIEAGSFVSPKWVPQMAGTGEVISLMEKLPGVHYPVLVPNLKGLETLLDLLSTTTFNTIMDSSRRSPSSVPPTDEIAIFTAATESFCKANINCTIAESLDRLSAVTEKAKASGLRVRGYVSVVIACPYEGPVDYKKVRDVTKALLDMGCYEVSLGDTTGMGTPATVSDMLDVTVGAVPVEKLAGHFHDTFGTAVANAMVALDAGIRNLDSSVGGLGGCPYSPGATGNVATEDILYALQGSKYRINGNPDLNEMVEIGWWISEKLGRQNASRAGRAIKARKERVQGHREKAKL